MIDESDCPACNAENVPMGTAGFVIHYCCHACGVWYSLDRYPE